MFYQYSRLTEKVVGFCILGSFLGILGSLGRISFPTSCQAKLVLAFSMLNVISHLAVVWNLLNDVFVISILVGVGFDVLSLVLYATCAQQWPMRLWLFGDFFIHFRALLLHASIHRMESVVTSATNNLKGIPGPYYFDHFFAYTDNGTHLLFLIASIQTCGWKISLQISGVVTILVLTMAIYSCSSSTTSTRKMPAARLLMTSSSPAKRPVCDCPTCRKDTCLSIRPLCELWFCTFEELLQKIDQAKTKKAKSH